MWKASHDDQLPIAEPPENIIYDTAVMEMSIDEVESSSTSSNINYPPDINKELI